MEQLGIQPSLLLAQIVNFTIIIIVLTKLLYKPILTMLEKRKLEIEEGLKITQRLRDEEEKIQLKKTKVLESARQEAQAIIEEARNQGKVVEKEIVKEAQKQADEIILKAKKQTESIHEDLLKAVRREAVELAVIMAKRLIGSVLTTDDKRKLLAKHVSELERANP